MATRKAITLVSGLFQEVNTPTDKLDFAGNTTADLTENTNLYYTDTRSRAAISVTDVSGDGSLAYNNSTGVITYTGPSPAEVRAHLSIASGSGLTYNSGTGEFGTSAIPNSQLANDDVTIGSTAVALGSTVTNFAGLGQLVMSDLIVGSGAGAANAINIQSGQVIFEGSTADANETILSAADATGGDKSLILPNESGTILSTGSSIANSNLANSSITIGSTNVALGATQGTFAGLTSLASTTLVSGTVDGANSITLASGNITFEGSTADGNEIILTAVDASGSDKTITLPNATGTVALLSTLSVASGSGLTYNSGTGEFSTNAIPNAQLANSSVTVGTTGIALGGSATTIVGLASVTSNAVVTNDNGFRIRDNSDNTKQLAFECSGISGSTTRTLTAPDANGTIATQAYVQAQITAEDLDVQTDSGNFDVDLDSEPLILTGGTGIDTSGSGTTATFAIDATVATLAGSQTLTNKSLTSPALTGSTSIGTGTTFSADGTMTTSAAIVVENAQPGISFVDTGANPDFIIQNRDGSFAIRDTTNAANRFLVDMANGNITATGNISVTGTVDGVDVATRDTLFGGLTASSGVLTNGVTATTQSANDNSTKVATTAYVDNQVTAEDLDVQTDSGNFDVDLDSEALTIAGGTGIDTSGTGTTATVAIDSTVTTLTGTQTLTNKSLTAPVLTGSSASAGSIIFKEDTDNGTNSATLKGPAATADVTLTLPASDGTVSTESFATAIAVALG
jgi:hypothetical protein